MVAEILASLFSLQIFQSHAGLLFTSKACSDEGGGTIESYRLVRSWNDKTLKNELAMAVNGDPKRRLAGWFFVGKAPPGIPTRRGPAILKPCPPTSAPRLRMVVHGSAGAVAPRNCDRTQEPAPAASWPRISLWPCIEPCKGRLPTPSVHRTGPSS